MSTVPPPLFTDEFLDTCALLQVNPFAAAGFPRGTKFLFYYKESSRNGSVVIFERPTDSPLAAMCLFEGEDSLFAFLPFELRQYEPKGNSRDC